MLVNQTAENQLCRVIICDLLHNTCWLLDTAYTGCHSSVLQLSVSHYGDSSAFSSWCVVGCALEQCGLIKQQLPRSSCACLDTVCPAGYLLLDSCGCCASPAAGGQAGKIQVLQRHHESERLHLCPSSQSWLALMLTFAVLCLDVFAHKGCLTCWLQPAKLHTTPRFFLLTRPALW